MVKTYLMNICNSIILGGCLGLLAVFLLYYAGNNGTICSTCESLHFHSKTKAGNISEEERLASSLWCSNREDGSKLCKFKNLYYIPSFKEHFLFLMNEYSVVSGIEDINKLSLSTIQNHSGVYLKLVIIKSVQYLLSKTLYFLETNSFIIKSFKSDNIMHVIHDDLLPMFVTYKELCHGDISLCISSYRLILIDSNDYRPYHEWYNLFSVNKPILIISEKNPICIEKGYFGLSNSSIWFQYGFKRTQGPLANTFFNSLLLLEFSKFIRKQFELLLEEDIQTGLNSIVFFSRKINRKILNEDFVEKKMIDITQSVINTNITVVNLDLSTNKSNIIIRLLKKSQLLVGVHGSAMIFAMFMQPGSHIIELFPFGIQPKFVSPVRALCKLQNVHYHYKSWVNTNEFNTRTHPEYPPLLGGVMHLEENKKKAIMSMKKVPAVTCCHDPVYLFRMFQDTIVDDSFFTLFERVVSSYSGLSMPESKVIEQNLKLMLKKWYFPPTVFNLTCKCSSEKLEIKWDYPFSTVGIDFSVATSNGISFLTKKTSFTKNSMECNVKDGDFSDQSISVWVKTVEGDKDSVDSFARCLT